MTLTWGMLSGLILAACVAWFWHDSLGVRELANRAAMEACDRLQLQFLDGTVAFARLWPARGRSGRMSLRRTYVFDYTADSIARMQGFVVLLGHHVESVGFANDPSMEMRQRAVKPEADPPPRRPPDADFGNVYDLKSWREDPRRIKERKEHDGRG